MDALFVTQPAAAGGQLLPSKRAFEGACEQDASKRNRNFAEASSVPVFNLHATSAGGAFSLAPAPPPPPPASLSPSSSAVIAFRLLCPVARSGSVIGRGGDVIGRVRAATRARIKVDMPLTPQCAERVVHLSSSASASSSAAVGGESGGGAGRQNISPSRCPAVDALLAVHDRILRGDAADETEEEEQQLQESETEEEEVEARLLIDTSQIGAVLGKKGSIVAATRAATGARLRVLPSRELPACSAPGDELLRISGGARSVRAALRLVAEQLRANPPRSVAAAAAGSSSSAAAAAAVAAAAAAASGAFSQQQQQLQKQQQRQYQHHPTAALAAALAVLNDDEEEEEEDDNNDGSDGGSPFLFHHHQRGAAPSRHSSSPFFSSPLAAGTQSPFSPFAGEFQPSASSAAAAAAAAVAAAAGQQQEQQQQRQLVLPLPPSADVTFRLLVPARAIGTVIGRGGDVARRLRAESGAWLKVHPVVEASSGSCEPAAEAGAATAERVVQLSSSCFSSSRAADAAAGGDFCSSPHSPCPSTPAAAVLAVAGLSPSTSLSSASSPPPLFLNAFSASFSASPLGSPSSPSSAINDTVPSSCPAVSALLACLRLVLADGGGVGARHSVRLLLSRPAALALLLLQSKSRGVGASPLPPSAPEHGSVLGEIAAATGATFRAEPAVGDEASSAAAAAPSAPQRLATAISGDIVLTISGAAAPAEAATRALAAALVRLQVSEAATRAVAKRAAGGAGGATAEMNNSLASPSRLGPWRSPPVSSPQQQQQHLRYDLWEGSSHSVAAPLPSPPPPQQQQQQQLFPSTTATVVRLDPLQAAAALGPAGANLAAVAAASGAFVRLVDGGSGSSNGGGSGGNIIVGVELSGGAAQVEAARAVVAAFVLAAGARPL